MSNIKDVMEQREETFCAAFYRKRAKYFSEFAGTALLTIFVKLSNAYFMLPPLAIGFGLVIIVLTYGMYSLAHFNPSVSLAFAIRNAKIWPRSDTTQVAIYLCMEYTGAIFGGFLSFLIGGEKAASIYPHIPASLKLSTFDRKLHAFFAEVTFTWLLCSVILHVATDYRMKGNSFGGLAIGFSLMVGAMCAGMISGSCLNSAVWLGCVLPALYVNNNIDLSDAWIYWTAPFIGAILAGVIFNVIYLNDESEGPDIRGPMKIVQEVSGNATQINSTMLESEEPHIDTNIQEQDMMTSS